MDKPGKPNPGNFSKDREKASDAGKKGGQASGSTGAGKLPDDRSKGSDSTKRGGQTPQGGGRK